MTIVRKEDRKDTKDFLSKLSDLMNEYNVCFQANAVIDRDEVMRRGRHTNEEECIIQAIAIVRVLPDGTENPMRVLVPFGNTINAKELKERSEEVLP